jgi:maleate isomerase
MTTSDQETMIVSQPRRIGLIVPSSNTTIETELPEMFRRQSQADGNSFTFHSSRAVLHEVDPESLRRMVEQVDRCGRELADARVDAYVYACLVALMAQGPGSHEEAERRIEQIAAERPGYEPPVISSAGALVRGIAELGLRRIAIVTPYVDALTELVVAYIEGAGITVVDAMSLRVSDNLSVGRLDPTRLPDLAAQLDTSNADGIVISACVQMPSLSAIPEVERRLDMPVLSAATASAWEVLVRLGIQPAVRGGGALLDPQTVRPSRIAAGG